MKYTKQVIAPLSFFLIIASICLLRIANVPPFTVSTVASKIVAVLPSSVPSSSSAATGATPADRAIHAAESRIRRLPKDSKGYVALADAYMQKSREVGDSDYYLRAETAVQRALALQPDSPLGLRTLAWVQTGKHEFREALATAERLLTQSPHDPLAYGLLGDAAVELGAYERAAKAFEKMVDLRPGMASYARLAYIRELFGEMTEATELMKLAVRAGSPRDPEPLAWSVVQLGNLYFHQGQLSAAENEYQTALRVFPHYIQAQTALARVRAAQQRYAEAIELYRQATKAVPAPDAIAELGDLFAFIGKYEEANKQYALVEYVEGVNAAQTKIYTRQLALFYADHDRQLDEAVTLAEFESSRRRDIYTYDTLAWVYYKAGRLTEAWQAMTQALRLGTKDASLFFHAGMIAYRREDAEKAQHYLDLVLKTNPYFSQFGVELARQTLAALANKAALQAK
jgi:tetratricopeptide (TPR) repeat protein